jgi:PPK2 family polyphosphate:nucleotide phosphotransferase
MTAAADWKALADAVRVPRGHGPSLTDAAAEGDGLCGDSKKDCQRQVEADALAINALQDRLYAEGRRALLVVLQGMDTSGKDGTVREVFNATGPIGVQVTPFGKPSDEELAHDYLWRVHRAVPRRGMIGIFTRSHYEDVLVVKVRQLAPSDDIAKRYDQINAFERHLTDNGVAILKFMLHISRHEQAERLRERLEDPDKQWKFNPGDLEERKRWSGYMAAYETMLSRCSTADAPWYVIPSDKKWRRNAIVARIVRGTLETMNPQPRQPGYDPAAFQID